MKKALPRRVDATFNEAADRYLNEFRGKDLIRALAALDSLIPYIGASRLIDIDDETLRQFKHDRQLGIGRFTRPAMVGTINKELAQVTTILNRACRVWHWLPSVTKLAHLVGERRIAYEITWSDQDRLFRGLPTGWDVGAAVFAINTGVRKDELFGLRWKDLVEVPEAETFVFVINRAISGKTSAIICNSIARRVVDAFREKDPVTVFPQTLTRCHERKVWIKAWDHAGLPADKRIKRGFENLRHTFAQRLRSAGVPDDDRNALLGRGHTSIQQPHEIKRLLAVAELITQRREQPTAPTT